jgi:hypothetical protein
MNKKNKAFAITVSEAIAVAELEWHRGLFIGFLAGSIIVLIVLIFWLIAVFL